MFYATYVVTMCNIIIYQHLLHHLQQKGPLSDLFRCNCSTDVNDYNDDLKGTIYQTEGKTKKLSYLISILAQIPIMTYMISFRWVSLIKTN